MDPGWGGGVDPLLSFGAVAQQFCCRTTGLYFEQVEGCYRSLDIVKQKTNKHMRVFPNWGVSGGSAGPPSRPGT